MLEIFTLSEAELSAVKLSMIVGFWSVAASLPFGIFFGWLLARYDFLGKSILDGFLHLPLVVPPVVTGYILLILFGRRNGVHGFMILLGFLLLLTGKVLLLPVLLLHFH